MSRQPMGYVGVLFLGIITLWLGWAAVDPVRLWRERSKKADVTVMQLARDLNEIERIRELWLGEPENAGNNAAQLVENAARYLERQGDLGSSLFHARAIDLRKAMQSCRTVLSDPDSHSLSTLQDHLTAFSRAYAICVCSIKEALKRHASLAQELNSPLDGSRFDAWKKDHTSFHQHESAREADGVWWIQHWDAR